MLQSRTSSGGRVLSSPSASRRSSVSLKKTHLRRRPWNLRAWRQGGRYMTSRVQYLGIQCRIVVSTTFKYLEVQYSTREYSKIQTLGIQYSSWKYCKVHHKTWERKTAIQQKVFCLGCWSRLSTEESTLKSLEVKNNLLNYSSLPESIEQYLRRSTAPASIAYYMEV